MITRAASFGAAFGRRGTLTLLVGASLTAWGGCKSSSSPFVLEPGMLAGTWKYQDVAGDTISVTISVVDTVLSGSGFATNAELRALSGGTVTEVPLTVTGWCSPAQRKLHLDGTSSSVPLLAAQLDATAQDATHLYATWTITVNGTAVWTQSTTASLLKS